MKTMPNKYYIEAGHLIYWKPFDTLDKAKTYGEHLSTDYPIAIVQCVDNILSTILVFRYNGWEAYSKLEKINGEWVNVKAVINA